MYKRQLFTSTSAVCVTGLVVQDSVSYWSAFGQAVILLLIQIGGLGVVTVAATFAMLSGRKISLMQRSTMQAVSYTHLDVYKRQVHFCCIFPANGLYYFLEFYFILQRIKIEHIKETDYESG